MTGWWAVMVGSDGSTDHWFHGAQPWQRPNTPGHHWEKTIDLPTLIIYERTEWSNNHPLLLIYVLKT